MASHSFQSVFYRTERITRRVGFIPGGNQWELFLHAVRGEKASFRWPRDWFVKLNCVSRLEYKEECSNGVFHGFSTPFQNRSRSVSNFVFSGLGHQLGRWLFFLTHLGFHLKIQIKVRFDRCETVESDSPNNIPLLRQGFRECSSFGMSILL